MPAGQPVDPRAPARKIAPVTQRELNKAVGQLDRRIPGNKDPEAIVKYQGPNQPARKFGRMWLEPKPPGGWPDA